MTYADSSRRRPRLTLVAAALISLGASAVLAGCDRNTGVVTNQPAQDGAVAMGAGTDGTGTTSVHNPGGLAAQGNPGPLAGGQGAQTGAAPAGTGGQSGGGLAGQSPSGGAGHVGSTRTQAGVTTNGNGVVLGSQGQAGSGDTLDRLPATSAGAQPAPNGSKPAADLAAADRNFIAQAAEGGLFEVEAGRLASERGQHAGVKSLGATLSSDHSDANQRLRDLAAAKGVTLPTTVSAAQRTLLQKLGQASGADFDRQFIADVGIRAHEQDIAAFQRAAKTSKDADIRAFAAATLPTLQHHLATARQLGAATGGAGTQR